MLFEHRLIKLPGKVNHQIIFLKKQFLTLRLIIACSYAHNLGGQLPDSLTVQLVEHWTGIAEVMGSNPVQASFLFLFLFFFRLKFHNCSSCVHNWDDQSYLHIILRSSNIWTFIYSFVLPYGWGNNQLIFLFDHLLPIESLSMTFTADGKRQRWSLINFLFL